MNGIRDMMLQEIDENPDSQSTFRSRDLRSGPAEAAGDRPGASRASVDLSRDMSKRQIIAEKSDDYEAESPAKILAQASQKAAAHQKYKAIQQALGKSLIM